MDNERVREFCLGLPHVKETVNWGHHLVYWVGDRDIGGKMFAMTDLDGTGTGVLWFHCGAERFHELQETEGVIASPYLAKAHWVTMERWDALRPREVEDELRRAHALIYEKLPKRTKNLLAGKEQKKASQRVGKAAGQQIRKSAIGTSVSKRAGRAPSSSARAAREKPAVRSGEPASTELRIIGQHAGSGARERR